MEISNHLNLAIESALKAGECVMEIYDSFEYNISIKDDNSPLTKADKSSNRIICKNLEMTKLPIISEENNVTPYEIRKNWKRFWMIDPLDGTKEFIKQNGEFTINIAQIVDNESYLGVVYCPASGILYYAEKNFGSFKVNIKNHSFKGHKQSKKIKYDKSKIKNKILVSRSHLNKKTEDYINNHSHLKIEKMGSSKKLCILAEGEASVYPRFAPIMEWDIVAGIIIINEARSCSLINIFFNTRTLIHEIDKFE